MTLYRYGWIAWIWRILIVLALSGGGLLGFLGVVKESPMIFCIGMPLVLPALFFGLVVAVQIDIDNKDALRIVSLIFWRRHIQRSRLRPANYRDQAYSESVQIHAPRLWIPVAGGLPIYIDLLVAIPDRRKFAAVFGYRFPNCDA